MSPLSLETLVSWVFVMTPLENENWATLKLEFDNFRFEDSKVPEVIWIKAMSS